MFMFFLYLFFEKKYQDSRNVILFLVFFILIFFTMHIFTFYIQPVVGLDTVIPIIFFELYVFISLKGNKILKLIIPVIAMMINTIITWIFLYLTMFFTGKTLESIATQSSIARYICVVLVNLTNLAVFIILLKFKKNKMNLWGISNVISFVGIPLLSMIVIYSSVYVFILTDYQSNVFPFVFSSCICMIAIATVVWYMISRISRDNNIKTELQLSELRTDMYKNDILNSNVQLEKMSKIKHDVTNKIAVLDHLIRNQRYQEAHTFCFHLLENISNVYSPIYTDNPVLNAVINVELEKAYNEDIDFSIELDSILPFVDDSDLVSLIGNICDNAIEYLSNCSEDKRNMVLKINQHDRFVLITCKNGLETSVLSTNPNLKTIKSDKMHHGKGTLIVRDVAEKYNGKVEYQEVNNNFVVSIFLEIPNLPKK